MSKTKIEIRAGVPVIVFPCGGCRPCGHAEYKIIKELEAEKAELIRALRMIDEGTTPYEDESGIIGIDLHKFPLDIIRKYITRKHTEEVKR